MKKYLIYMLILLPVFPITSYGAILTGYHIDKNVNLIPNDPNGNKKVILITIDDGPSKYSKEIVSVFNKHNAKAIFFVNGMNGKHNKGVVASVARDGFTIGNHTWSHLNLNKEKNIKKIQKEIEDNNKWIKNEAGITPRFFRAPYGMTNPYVKDFIKKNGMVSMNWSGSAQDWDKNTRNKKVFIDNVTSTIHPGEIILMHEHEWTAKYLDDLLSIIEQQGYTFINPDEITH